MCVANKTVLAKIANSKPSGCGTEYGTIKRSKHPGSNRSGEKNTTSRNAIKFPWISPSPQTKPIDWINAKIPHDPFHPRDPSPGDGSLVNNSLIGISLCLRVSVVNPAFSAPPRLRVEKPAYANTAVLFPYTTTRFSRCQRTARDRTTFSTSPPLRIMSSRESRWPMRTMSWSMMGPSSSTSVT